MFSWASFRMIAISRRTSSSWVPEYRDLFFLSSDFLKILIAYSALVSTSRHFFTFAYEPRPRMSPISYCLMYFFPPSSNLVDTGDCSESSVRSDAVDDCIFDDCPCTEGGYPDDADDADDASRVGFLLPHIGGGGAASAGGAAGFLLPHIGGGGASAAGGAAGFLFPHIGGGGAAGASSASGIGASDGPPSVFSFLLGGGLLPHSIGGGPASSSSSSIAGAGASARRASDASVCGSGGSSATPDSPCGVRRLSRENQPRFFEASGFEDMRLMSALSRGCIDELLEKHTPIHRRRGRE